MRVVEPPIGDRRARDASAKCFSRGQCHQRHVVAVAPAHDADAIGCDERLGFQEVHAAQLIFDFHFAGAVGNHRLEGVAPKTRAVVEREHDEAVLCEHLSKQTLCCAGVAIQSRQVRGSPRGPIR